MGLFGFRRGVYRHKNKKEEMSMFEELKEDLHAVRGRYDELRSYL